MDSKADHHKDRPAARAAGESLSGTAKYVCPMHPEVVRDAPGECASRAGK